MKTLFLAIASITLCTNLAFAGLTNSTSPFAVPSTLPLQAPPFDKIKDNDYKPAFEEGMKQQLIEINAIANNPDVPTFKNTIEAMEQSGRILDRVSKAFFAVVQANTNATLDQVLTEEAPKLAAHQDEIYLNAKLFQRVKAIYEQRDALNLDAEALQVLKIYYMQFVHAGANLNAVDKTRLRQLNQQIASLETSFQQKLLAATKANELIVHDKAELAGLSDEEINALTVTDGNTQKYVISLQNTTQQPLLVVLKNRNTREKLFNRSWHRTEQSDDNDTRDLIAMLAKIRAEKAKLFDYPSYAAYTLYDQMAPSSDAVHQFLGQLVPPATAKVATEAKTIQAFIDKDNHFDLKPWDWNHYAEKVRKAQYDLDENQLKPYFELNNVLKNGVFYSANLLYGVSFKERDDLPVYHPDVRVFDVFDKDGSQLGLFYIDYFRRDNKTGGAWMSDFVSQTKLLGTKPVIYNVANFTKPAAGQPALLTLSDVRTIFHEFGHALHGLFADTIYPTLGSNMARDFVEFPSQFNERFAFSPEVLNHFAVHYKTGKPIPKVLVDKINKAATFNQGYALGELLAAAELDLQWHELGANAGKQDVNAFESQALKKTHTDFMNVPPRYRTSYFQHIWAGGYAAGYYAYLWTEMLADDGFSWFMKHGGLTRENGDVFRKLILSRGHTQDYFPMFRAFYGKDPDIEPMLEHLGLLQTKH